LAKFPEAPGMGDLNTFLTSIVTMEVQELVTYVPYLYTWRKYKRRLGFNCACNRNCTFSRLHTYAAQFKIGVQFPDIENAQRYLQIVQIPRLHGTAILSLHDDSTERSEISYGLSKCF